MNESLFLLYQQKTIVTNILNLDNFGTRIQMKKKEPVALRRLEHRMNYLTTTNGLIKYLEWNFK